MLWESIHFAHGRRYEYKSRIQSGSHASSAVDVAFNSYPSHPQEPRRCKAGCLSLALEARRWLYLFYLFAS